MKSSMSESICAAKAVKYKREKLSPKELKREGNGFNSDFSPQRELGKNLSSSLTNRYAVS